jgi:hypothetical protein
MSVLKIRHWIACSPQDVWDAYTTPEKFCQFFAPEGLSIPLESVVLEVRVGGRFECDMVFDETGVVNENKGILTAVEEPNLLVGEEPSIGFRSTQRFLPDSGGTLISIDQEVCRPNLPRTPKSMRLSARVIANLADFWALKLRIDPVNKVEAGPNSLM